MTTRHDRELLVRMLGSGSASDMRSGTLVVVPSITFPETELRKLVGIQFYEERLLFLLLLLRHPELRIVFVTSLRVEEPIVDYYLRFVPPEVRPGDRLWLLALWDARPRALTEKLLERPDALSRLRTLAGDGDACLLTFNVSAGEGLVAEEVGAPLYGCPPDLVSLGSKSGARRVGREAGVAVPAGAEDLHSVHEVEKALDELRASTPRPRAAVVKLNDGFSGQGNAIVDLADGPLEERTVFCAEEESWPSFAAKLEEQGGVVEELLRAPGMASPSVQMRIAPDGTFEVVSTHDQVLGGPDDQVYLGCRFPADARYREVIQDAGRRVARVLAERGVMGSFGIDFVIGPRDDAVPYMTEINLRMGGTTHPFLMTEFVTGGAYDESTGELVVDGRPKHYVATDNLKSDEYVGLEPQELVDAIDAAGLAFDRAGNTGVLLHLLGALKRYGKVGMTCVADSAAEADELYEMATGVLGGLCRR